MTGSVLRRLAAVMAPLVVLVSFVLTGVAATPASALVPGSMSAATSSSWQTNATVWKMTYANGDIYLVGDFTSVRPSGDALGTGEVPATYFAALNASTGALDTAVDHTHSFTGQASGKLPLTGGTVAASPDGSVIYVGGGFTAVDGVTRNHLAAFSATTGALLSWNPKVNGKVSAIATNGTTVYIGGTFTKVGTTTTGANIAAISASTGKALSWGTGTQPSADNLVDALAVSPDGTQVVAGGYFDTMDGLSSSGTTTYNKAAIIGGMSSSTPGALEPMPADSVVPVGTTAHNPNNCISNVKDAVISGGVVYLADEGTGGGCFDGTWAANLSDGSLAWVNHCLGATQTVEVVNNYLYKGSHMHDCALTNTNGDPANFPQIPGDSRHLASENLSNGFLGPWYPLMNAGVNLGPRTMATDGTQLYVGGDFTTVNGIGQQGVARFTPNNDYATPKPAQPIVVPTSSTSVEVSVEAPLDYDDPDLTLELFRDGGTTPIATTNVTSYFWRQPIVSWNDTGLAAGTHSYTVKALETDDSAAAPTAASTATKVTIPATVGSYATAVQATAPTAFWQLNEAKGLVAADASATASGQGGVMSSTGVTYGVAGPTADGTNAVTLDGKAGMIVDPTPTTSPTSFSLVTWFKTTTTTGGKIIGFGNNNRSPLSSTYDKQIYMTNAGKLIFGVYTGSTQTISSSSAYNDGKWHQVVATQGSSGMRLYVDGNLVASGSVTTNQSFTGYWRIGGDNLGSWPSAPSSNYFSGSIGDVGIYDGNVLPATTVSSLYTAAQ